MPPLLRNGRYQHSGVDESLLSLNTPKLLTNPVGGQQPVLRTGSVRVGASTAFSNSCSNSAANRGVLVLPGLANKSGDYDELSQHLRHRGLAAHVVQVGFVTCSIWS
jgi:hypothetical protein